MKNLKRITLLIALSLSGLTFAQSNGAGTTSIEKKEVKTKKFKPSKDMVNLFTLKGKITMKLGQKGYYSGHVHGSVGITKSAYTSDDGVKLIDTHFSYDDDRKANMSGGDAGTKTFIFKAEKKGTYTLKIEDGYRGDVKSVTEIEITVE